MKKNVVYIQTSILNEVMKNYTSRDVADKVMEILADNGDDVTVYETHEDSIVFRKKRDGIVTDTSIIKAFVKALRKIIKHSKDDGEDLVDAINDNYDFEYDEKYLDEGFFSTILSIRRSGRLIYIEIDLG